MDRRVMVIHGHEVSYQCAANGGSPMVLLHGIAGSSEDWSEVADDLGRERTVIAPDLLGHGESAKPRGDYSLGAYAGVVRDLLDHLGYERATIVGHSLGGGIALQFSYLFPERCERLVLVASGGLGREVGPALRAASLPGSELALPLLLNHRVVAVGDKLDSGLRKIGLRPGHGLQQTWVTCRRLARTEARSAFLHTLRSTVDVRGQRVSALDRLYLATRLPVLLIWGEQDRMIPITHGRSAGEHLPNSELVSFPGIGHFPHQEVPAQFTSAVLAFLEATDGQADDGHVPDGEHASA